MNLIPSLIIYFYLYFNKGIKCETFTFEPPNLKTVLFKETDLMFRCWSMYEVDLLRNRRVLQDLIPRKIPRDLPLLLKYLTNIEETAHSIPPGMNQTLLISALGDVVGGYLQAIVIPIANEAYYAGNVEYTTVANLHKMLNRWKWYLSTDGGMWSQECDMHKIPTKVTPLEISLHDREAACQELYVAPTSSQNDTEYLGSETVVAESSRISIPYLDNNFIPSAMALPFRNRNLYSLMDPRSAYILVKYYTLSMRCLSGKEADVVAFNNFFHQWIVSKVVPHLHDQDHWYPAFGAVMRVIETIKVKGLASAGQVFVPPINDDKQDNALNTNLDIGEDSDTVVKNQPFSYFNFLMGSKENQIIFGLVIAILVFFCCIVAICCAMTFKKRQKATIVFNDYNALKMWYYGLLGDVPKSGSETSANFYVEGEKVTLERNESAAEGPYPSPRSYAGDLSDVSLTLTSESEEEYTTTAKEEG